MSSNSTLNDNIFLEVQSNIFSFYLDCIQYLKNIIFENKNKLSYSKMNILVSHSMKILEILNCYFLNLKLIKNDAQVY